MAVHGGKSKIRHKNMVDGVAENGGCHGRWFSHLKEDWTEKKNMVSNRKKNKNGTVKNKMRGSNRKTKKKSCRHQKRVSNSKKKSAPHWSCAATFAFVRVLGAGSSVGARRCRGVMCQSSSLPGRACGPWGRRCWVHGDYCVRGVAPGRVLRSVLRFHAALLNKITGRVGSSQPNSYRAKKQKKTHYFRHFRYTTMTAMAPSL